MSQNSFSLPISLPVATLLALVGVVALSYVSSNSGPLPPGPKGWPFLGVWRLLPQSEYWKTYAQWGGENGHNRLISFHVLGRRTVVINTAKVAEDLLDRRSAVYSDRPFPMMAGKLMKREKSMFQMPYNQRLKTYRRLMHQAFNPSAVRKYAETLEHEARVLVSNLLEKPYDMPEHLRRNAAAVTMKIAYGYTIAGNDDPFVSMAEESLRLGSLAAAPGRWLVDSFPFLQYLPEWLPGAAFKKQAREWGTQLYNMSREPHDYVKRNMIAGTAIASFTSDLLCQDKEGIAGVDAEQEDIILWTSSAIYAAGADTTVAAVKAFIFAMMMHPDIQRRAQQEVDKSIQKEGRLPQGSDRGSLPYLECILKETLRWSAPAPMGLPHCTAQDDIYDGYRIPAGTTVIANIWAMLHDEDEYPDAAVFDPGRFAGTKPQKSPGELVWGFGRRVCPGRYLAEQSILLQMALILASVDITKPLDEQDRPIEPEVAFTTAIVSHIKPFQCCIKERSVHSAFLPT